MPGKQYEITAQNTLTAMKTFTGQTVYQNLTGPIFSFPNPKYLGVMVPTVELSKLHLLQVLTY